MMDVSPPPLIGFERPAIIRPAADLWRPNKGVSFFQPPFSASQRVYAAPTFVGAVAYDAAPGTASRNYPTSASGDLILAARACDANLATWDVPAGWLELIADGTNASGVDYQVLYKIRAADTSVSLTLAGNGGALNGAYLIAAIRGVDQTTPIDAVAGAISTGGTGNPDCPSVTTITPNAMVVAIGFLDDDRVASITAPSGYSNASFATASGSDGTQACSTMLATAIKATPGAENPGAFASAKDDQWVGFTLAVRPA